MSTWYLCRSKKMFHLHSLCWSFGWNCFLIFHVYGFLSPQQNWQGDFCLMIFEWEKMMKKDGGGERETEIKTVLYCFNVFKLSWTWNMLMSFQADSILKDDIFNRFKTREFFSLHSILAKASNYNCVLLFSFSHPIRNRSFEFQ